MRPYYKRSAGIAGLAALMLLTVSCKVHEESKTLKSGAWRGEFALGDKLVPFNFTVSENATRPHVFLLNGTERALLDSMYYRGDSLVIPIDLYDAVLVGRLKGDSLQGFFRKNQASRRGIPFRAARNQSFRFEIKDKSTPPAVAGTWSVTMTSEREGKKTSRYTVGVFAQEGHNVTGSILTTTGDYRYLDGVVDGKALKLSAFSGSNPTLIDARLTDATHFTGEFISPGGKVWLDAVKSDTAKLPDAYALTHLRPGFDRLSFSFPDLEGKAVTLTDAKYKGKVVVVTILGSWCPNCIDEAAFLSPWYKQNKARGVEIVGLSFERKDDLALARTRLTPLIRRYDIEYDILFAGIADKQVVAQKLPELNTFLSFPTTFFIDRSGKVRKVHTGYNGPATGKYYDEFIHEFNAEVDALVGESAGL
jgi:peroxiredoxin